MRCPEIVGRERQLEALRARLGELADGRGSVVVLVGEAGAGKSRLLAEVSSLAAEQGATRLAGRAVPGDSPVPYRPIAEAFLAVFRTTSLPDDPSLAGFGPQLSRLVPGWGGSDTTTDDSPLLVGEAAVRVLNVLASGGDHEPMSGAVLLLEDLHWADAETLAVLDHLADATADVPVLCVATSRADGPAADLLDRLERRRPGAVIDVGPLDEHQMHLVVGGCLETADPPPGVDDFVRAHADGNPFLAEELLAGLVAAGSLESVDGVWSSQGELTPAVPASLHESIGRRLAALEPGDRRVLSAAALLGRHFDWELLPGIAEADGRAVVDALRAAVDEQLIDVEGSAFAFRHALTREVIVGDLLPPERRALAARAWPAIERAHPGLPGPSCELAADLAEAAGEPAAAAERLLESARRAFAAGAIATAEQTARRGRRLADADPDLAVDLDELLVHVLVAAGRPLDAMALGASLVALLDAADAPPGRRADLLVSLARAGVTAGDLGRAGADVEHARLIAGDEADPSLAARIDAIAAHVALDGGDLGEAARQAEQARAGAAATDQPEVECDALILLGRLDRVADAGAPAEWFTRAAGLAEANGLGTWHLRAQHEIALQTVWRGDPGPLQETRAVAARYGAMPTVAVLDLALADLALTRWEADACRRAAVSCVETSRRFSLATESVANLWLAGAGALVGDDAAMQAALDAALAPDPDDPRILGDLYGRVLLTKAFLAGDVEGLPELLDTMMLHVRRSAPTVSVFPGRVTWALVHTIDDDDHGRAARAELVETTEPLGMELFTLGDAVCEAVALGRQGDVEGATSRFEAANSALCANPMSRPASHASALLVAPAAQRDGWGDPVRWLREAEAFFGERGYGTLARRLRAALADAGAAVPRRGRGQSDVPESLRALGVTSREVDVLKLVAEGRTNKDIAAELFLSPKTVERHVASLFDRLGVRSRRDLATLAPTHLGDGGP